MSNLSIVTVTPALSFEQESSASREVGVPNVDIGQGGGEGTKEDHNSEPRSSSQGLATAMPDPFVDETATPTHNMLIHSASLSTLVLGTRLGKPKATPTSQSQTRTSSSRNSLSKFKEGQHGKGLEYPGASVMLCSPAGMLSARSRQRQLPPAEIRVDGLSSERRDGGLEAGSASKADARNEGYMGTESSPLGTLTCCSVLGQIEAAGDVGTSTNAIQDNHTAPLESSGSRKESYSLLVREKEGQCPPVHKRKPIPLFESPESDRSPSRLDIFPPRRPLAKLEHGSLNKSSLALSMRTPPKRVHLAETSNLRAYGENMTESSTKVQYDPVGPNESNPSTGSVGPETILGVNEPNRIQVGEALSTSEGPKGARIVAEADEPGPPPLVHSYGRRFTKAVGVKNLFTRAPRIENSPPKLQAHRTQLSSYSTWPNSSVSGNVSGPLSSKVLTRPSEVASVNTPIKAELAAQQDHKKREKQSTWHSSIAFARKPWNSKDGMEVKKESKVSSSQSFLKKGSGKKSVPTILQIGLPDPGSFRHLNSNGRGTEPPMRTHIVQNSLNRTGPEKPRSAAENGRGVSRSYRGFSEFFSQTKGHDDKGKCKKANTSTKPTQSFLTRLKGTTSNLSNTPKSTPDLSRHTTPKRVKALTTPLQLNPHTSSSLASSLPHASPHNNQFYQLQSNETNTTAASKTYSSLLGVDTPLDMNSLESKDRKLTGGSSLPVLKVTPNLPR